MSLSDEINKGRKEIFTDSYPMSIGELVNMYRDGEIEINPEFQRFYRWSESQKVRLIESILLGIPLPSMFVSQREDGVWEVVDGLQRTSTILEFMGELKDESGNTKPALKLKSTKYLPSLEGMMWEDENKKIMIDEAIKRTFKREKIELKIVKKESDKQTKYELFQRLNTGGSQLSQQEVRNCLMIMLDKNTYNLFHVISKTESFKTSTSLTERLLDERYDMELCLRASALYLSEKGEIDVDYKKMTDIGDFLDESTRLITDMDAPSKERLSNKLESTYNLICETLDDNAFKKFNNGVYKGGFSIAIYEVITMLSIFLVDEIDSKSISRDKAVEIIKNTSENLVGNIIFQTHSGSGVRASTRIPKLMELTLRLCK